jgi:predicted methyltransferase
MKLRDFAGALAAGLLITIAARAAGAADTGAVASAIADPGRPAADAALDAARKPAELLAAIGLKAGDRVVDIWPGAYWDRLFSKAVGPSGHVYMFWPLEAAKAEKVTVPPEGSAPLPGYPNVTVFSAPVNAFKPPEPVDMVWIRQNYHDLYDPFMGAVDVAAFDKSVFEALKSGGVFVVIDHSAPDGSGLAATNTTHRIDAARVKADMAAAGFVFAGESDALRNPADPRDKLVFDPSIRGKTDQFVYLFRKP